MIVGIAGAGLIGGSVAKAYSKSGHRVFIYDKDKNTLDYAILSGVAEGELTDEILGECDLLMVALYPTDTVAYMREAAPKLKRSAVLIDCGGTKETICREGEKLAAEYGFIFAGGHPMAGTHKSGFRNSSEDLFRGAPMVVVMEENGDILLMEKIKNILKPLGFSRIVFADAKNHDRVIAFTSQMAHIASNAYVKSETAERISGISAGSYRDMTRVAYLNEDMWTDLFMDNRDNLLFELDSYINSLTEYRDALAAGDETKLRELLKEGREKKERLDGAGDKA